MKHDAFRELLGLLRRLDEAKIAYRLNQCRDDALMVEASVPGERWEIEMVDYGAEVQFEIERFVSNGVINDDAALEDLFSRFSDKEAQALTHE